MAEIVDFGLQQHKIKMDSRYFENVLSVVAGDTGRRLEVQLLDTNGTVQDTTGLKLRLNAVIAGKPTFTDATLVDATTGKYRLDLSNGMFLAPGNWQFQWQITDSAGKKLHSFAFTGNIGKNISEGGSQATNFYLNLEDLKAMQEDLVNGTFDFEVLETNIAEKLTDLETQYAPKLTEVTAQLAQTMTQVEFDSWVATILDGGPSIFVETLTALESAYPNGSSGIALVRETDPAKIYVWNSTEWQDFGNYQGILDEEIYLQKSDVYGNALTIDNYINGLIKNSINSYDTYTIKSTLTPIVTEEKLMEVLSEYVDVNNDIRLGALGDSITDLDPINPEKGYLYKIERDYGIKTYNYAVAGSGITNRGAETNTAYPPVYDQMLKMKEEHPYLDVITLLVGVNDWQWGDIPLGNIDDTGLTTVMGAYNHVLSFLNDNYPDSLIIVITPLQRARFTQVLDNVNYTEQQKQSYTEFPLDKWSEAIEQVSKKHSVSVYDAYHESGLYFGNGVENGSQHMIDNFTGAEDGTNPDGLHPNGRGHDKWYKRLAGFMLQNLGGK